MKKLFTPPRGFRQFVVLLILQLLVQFTAIAQQPIIQSATQDGYQLSIESYHSTIESETNFSYTVSIQLPAGNIIHYSPQGITAKLYYPSIAQYVGINYTSPFGSTPGYTPVVNHANSTTPCDATNPGWVTVHLNLPSPNLNTATLPSFTVTVKVPASQAVAGPMNAHATLQYPDPQSSDSKSFNTNNVAIPLQITNPWQVRKYAINTFHVGNGPLGSCNDAIVGDIIQYRVEIFLQNGADIRGSQDITLTSMRDIPMTGAINLAGCTFGSIQNEFNMANLSGFGGPYGAFTIPTGSGAIVLRAANALNNTNHRFRFQMTMPPSVTSGTCINNHIEFSGVDFCGNQIAPPQSFHSYVEKRPVAPADVVVTKNVWQAGNTSGCPGFYAIRVMNRTNVALSNGFTYYDIMPLCMMGAGVLDLANVTIADVSSAGVLGPFSNCTNCFTPDAIGTFSSQKFKVVSSSNIPIDAGQEIRIPFTIGNTCQDCFTNFIYENENPVVLSEATAATHATICLLPDATIPCVQKSVCEDKQYKIGNIIRFRLTIQNYGTVPMQNWTLIDDLKRVGLSYVGNESFYVAAHRSATGSSCLGFNPANYPADVYKWDVSSPPPYNHLPPTVATINTPTTREVSFQFSTFDIGCDGNTLHENNINNCIGAAGQNLPAFFIEFDAKVENDVGIGESMNISTLFDATSPTPVQHVLNPPAEAPFTVTDDINLTVKKEVSVDGGNTFHTGGVTAQPGQTIQYKLSVNNTGLTLRQPFLLDYLPQNVDDLNPVVDRYLIANSTNPERGSNSDVFYLDPDLAHSTIGFSQEFVNLSPQPQSFSITQDLGSTGSSGGSYNPVWTPLAIPPDPFTRNFRIKYSVLPFGSTLRYIYNATISGNEGETACNTFAVRGRKNSMYNYQPITNGSLQLPAESPSVCVQIANALACCIPVFNIPQDICKKRATQFCVSDGCECQPDNMQNTYTWDFGDGTTYTGIDKCVAHAFADAISYTITVSWVDCNGQQQGPQVFIRDVMPCDDCAAVSAMYAVTTSPTNSSTHTYDPSASTTSGMQIIGYSWHLTEMNGSNFVFNAITYPPTASNQSANPNLTITFPHSGLYCMTLTLLVLDPDGNACKCNPSITECIEDGGALQDKFSKNIPVSDDLKKIDYYSLLKGKLFNKVKKSNYSTRSSCCRPVTFDIPNDFCPNVVVQFCVKDDCTCLANDEQNVYTWYFDDGIVLTGKCISRAFTTANLYHVVLTYVNCQNETIDDYPPFEINVKDCPVDECPNVRPDFTATPAGLRTLTFTSTTTPSSQIALYVWDFGDQTSDFGPLVTHTYTSGGSAGNTPFVTLHVYINNSTGNPCSCPDKVTHQVFVPDHRQSQATLKKIPLKSLDKPVVTLTATPNPFTELLTVSLKTSQTAIQEPSYILSFININGATLFSKSINSNKSVYIDTKYFSAGMYLLRVIGSNGTIYKTKLIKIK